jgi:hypothetical protein
VPRSLRLSNQPFGSEKHRCLIRLTGAVKRSGPKRKCFAWVE